MTWFFSGAGSTPSVWSEQLVCMPLSNAASQVSLASRNPRLPASASKLRDVPNVRLASHGEREACDGVGRDVSAHGRKLEPTRNRSAS